MSCCHNILEYVVAHAGYAHWIVFGLTLLAGCNVPVSLDLIVATSAILAATVVPENLYYLYVSVIVGASLSAWIAYGIGRLLGRRLLSVRFFADRLSESRLIRIRSLYRKGGFWALLAGRFIPFGVRNCIFMTAGMSRVSFGKFVLYDALACTVWGTVVFAAFYRMAQSCPLPTRHLGMFGMALFLCFSLAVIGLVWYKKQKKRRV
ncbi:MAG: DedA family protein [Simkaniaceae bacterium]|nr:DedA family protein [Simkaniaceae bacterium]